MLQYLGDLMTWIGVFAKTLRTTALSLVYLSSTMHQFSVTANKLDRLIDSVLNAAWPLIVIGCLCLTPTDHVPIFSGILKLIR